MNNSHNYSYVDDIVNNYAKVVYDPEFRDYVITSALIYVFVCLRSIKRNTNHTSKNSNFSSNYHEVWLVHVWNNLNLWHDIISDVVLYMTPEEINFILDEKIYNIEYVNLSVKCDSINSKPNFTVLELIRLIKNHMDEIEKTIPNVANIVMVNNIMDS